MAVFEVRMGNRVIRQIPLSTIAAYSLNEHPDPVLGLYAFTVSIDKLGLNPTTYFFADFAVAQAVNNNLNKSIPSGPDVVVYLEAVDNQHL